MQRHCPIRFIGLRSKMYSLLLSGNRPKITAKGIKKSDVSKHVTHDMFRHTLENKTCTTAEFLYFRSRNHVIQTMRITRFVSLHMTIRGIFLPMAELPSHTDITEYELFVLYIIPSNWCLTSDSSFTRAPLYRINVFTRKTCYCCCCSIFSNTKQSSKQKQLKSSKNSNRTF